MHQKNTGSSQQTQVRCLFTSNSNSSREDPESKGNSHPSNYLYCYFKGDTSQESLSLPLHLLSAHLQVLKILCLKGRFQSHEGKSLGRGISKGFGVVLSDTTGENSSKDWSYNLKSHWHSCKNQKKTRWQTLWTRLGCFPSQTHPLLVQWELQAILYRYLIFMVIKDFMV